MSNSKGCKSPPIERQDTQPCMDNNTFNFFLDSSPSTNQMLDNLASGTFFGDISSLSESAPSGPNGPMDPASSQLVVPTNASSVTPVVGITSSNLAAALRRANSSGGGSGPAGRVTLQGLPGVVNFTRVPSSRPHASGIQGVTQIQNQFEVLQAGPVGSATMYLTNTRQITTAPCVSQGISNALPSSSTPGTSSYDSSSFPAMIHSPGTQEASEAIEEMIPADQNESRVTSLPQLSGLSVLNELNDTNFSSEPKFNPSLGASKMEKEINEENLNRADSIDVLQLTDWPGKYNFTISFPTDSRNNRKWGYCDKLKRVFCQPNIAIEVQIRVDDWRALEGTDAKVRLCPVYTDAHHRTKPVNRCDHHKLAERMTNESVEVDYLIQIDQKNAEYSHVGPRQVVSAPLLPSRLGDEFVTLLVKSSCMTSCVGGPNRRPFAVIFSLMVEGREAGRRVQPIKCCKGVARDMKAEKNRLQGGEGPAGDPPPSPPPPLPAQEAPKNTLHTITIVETKKRRGDRGTPCSSDPERPLGKKMRPTNRPVTLPDSVSLPAPPGYCYILLPVEYKQRVTEYLNGLRALDVLREKHPDTCRHYNI